MDNNEASGSSIMMPLELEMDEEISSLFNETNGRGNLRKRTRVSMQSLEHLSDSGTGFRGLLRSKTAFMIRNACLLATLAWMVFMFMDTMDRTIEALPMVEKDPRGIHQSSFGGKNNPTSIAGVKAHHKHPEEMLHDLDLIPESNVGQRVQSVSIENKMNHIGHYWHDPHQSVYSSPLYDNFTEEEMEKAQEKFLNRLNATKQKFGDWQLLDPYYDQNQDYRPHVDFDVCPDRDCNTTDFPVDAWQLDEDYVGKLIEEAKNLVQRVREGIYEEYGHSSSNVDGSLKSEKEREERNKIFQVIVADANELNEQNVAVNKDTKEIKLGVAQLSQAAWDGLVRKLLHSLVSNDDFFVVVAGDGAAAGHGNNFLQSPVMQFHYLLEPVLDFLGIRLISRNMAMKEQSVVFSAMGGADVYGEMDLLWYDSRSENDSSGAKDLLYKQSILSGERVPVILTNDPVNLSSDSSFTSWIGNLQPNEAICGSKNKGVCDMMSHNSVCWVPRVMVTPTVDQDASIPPESFPGNYAHQLEARKLSLLVLAALDAALDQWVNGIEKEGFPLADSFWHIGDQYTEIRENVRTSHNDGKQSDCEFMMKDLAMVCHVEMHGNTEWTPCVTPYVRSLRALLPNLMDVSNFYTVELYLDVDLMPPQWAIPDDQVDPHLIAISTSAPPPLYDDDQSFIYDDDGTWMIDNDDAWIDPNILEGSNGGGVRSLRRSVRRLVDSTTGLSPGKGWTMQNAPSGFCDGSAQSTCGRDRKKSSCLMAGHNDHQAGIMGDALSGWLIFKVPNIKEGIILARFDTQVAANSDPITEKWTTIDNKDEGEDIPSKGRRLVLPKDFWFDYAINGEVTTLSRTDFMNLGVDIDGGMTVHPLFVDPDMGEKKRTTGDEGETIEVAIRIRSKQNRAVTIMLTHVYYA